MGCEGVPLVLFRYYSFIYGVQVYKCHTEIIKNEVLLEKHSML